ncbi:glycine zipper 2TM domain-containing protein [Rhodocyclus tenuis]|uniref:Glycine zipper 2TM domain-containing protein n=2 Tax=Rhodocyclus TaxID=1064 RepID=A0A6L5JZ68_RHOTE|nr:glycine zipper 2TM domain-containing protein [Rhodocyclus gracilis]MQY51944.1 glycine zipper 2TM domain-containing protein [Rhodocyclus gracilis]MRD73722.1 glycine zipper 2TM domain-containing protein [Rhodocyclus gracilis]NJA89802.1 glycine zipper 2TM domain-containing protein [Rhodocyclus gracilis]
MKNVWIPALITSLLVSANAFADPYWDRGYGEPYGHHPHHERFYEVQEPVVVYQGPPVVYQPAPRVIYQERIIYRDRPVPVYAAPVEPRYYQEQTRVYQAPPPYNGNRVIGQALGAVAGGILGNQVGAGNGRVAATAVGAVVGSMVGGNLSE